MFGRIYEYFLTQFADQKALDGGEFFTPISLVQFIANVLEPTSGTIFDPACGSGGMFVQSARIVEQRHENPSQKLTFRGLEKNKTTINLAKMNLAVHGLEGDIQQRLEGEFKREYHIITAQKRLEQVAKDFVWHDTTEWETGKAMIVCIDKVTCVRLYNLILPLWDERIKELEREIPNATDEQDAQFRERQLSWMRQTRTAVVVSEEQGEVEKFRKWDIDIKPHRKLIKDGFDLPNGQRLNMEDAFKRDDHPFRIVMSAPCGSPGLTSPASRRCIWISRSRRTRFRLTGAVGPRRMRSTSQPADTS